MTYNVQLGRTISCVDQSIPGRVCMNFTKRCNMACRYCYIPFTGARSNPAIWFDIVDKVAAWGCDGITFGGGDPMIHRPFRQLLRHAAHYNLFVHLDTNGLCIRDGDLEIIEACVDLIGLPLDGPDAQTHGFMRGHPTHFQTILKLLIDFAAIRTRVKINTVVSRVNASEVGRMVNIINEFDVRRWSLYRFWPIGPIAISNSKEFLMSQDRYLELVLRMQEQCSNCIVERGDVGARHRSYFFVTDLGSVYSVDPADRNKYMDLGSIFDVDILRRWELVADPSLNARRLRSRALDLPMDDACLPA